MDDHITPHPEIRRNGGKHTEHLFIEIAEKVAYNIVRTGGSSGVKVLNNHLIFYIHRGGRIQDHTA